MILALDLDDTLLRTDKTISPRNRAALQRWLAAGHQIVIATGRPPRHIEDVLPLELHSAPRVVYNGAQVHINGEVVYRNEIDPDAVRTVLGWVERSMPDWHVGLEIDDTLYLNRPSRRPGPYVVTNLPDLCDRPAAKIIFLFPDGRGDMTPLLAALPPSTRALITPKFTMVQLCGRTTDKADALAFLLQQAGHAAETLVAIGDDVNDVDMVRNANIGIAVANAVDEVKAVADWITATNDADGVAIALEQILDRLEPKLQETTTPDVATQPLL
jgi:hydroxymethylpyrimidine pyrophosphatase-like HAD family hydrolase